MGRSQIIKEIQNIKNLPTLPSIAIAVNKLLKDYDSPIDHLVALLEKDPSLVMKILRLVNSSFFGFKSKVKSVGHAVTLLGYNTVQNAVVAVSVMEALSVEKELNGFEIDHFWEHAINVAVLSKYIALNTKLTPPEDAFTAGLLHDIGKIVLVNFFPELFVRIMHKIDEENRTFYDAEKFLDLPPHSLIGSILAQQWMLPDAMVDSIKYHHNGHKTESLPYLTAVVHLSDNIVHMMSGDTNYHLGMESLDDEGKIAAKKFFQENPGWLKEIKQEMTSACDFFKKG